MEHHCVEDRQDEKIVKEKTVSTKPKNEANTDLAEKSAEMPAVKEEPVTAIVEGHPKDRGEWKFRPWKGMDHWVNERTKVTTFDAKKLT